MKTEISRDSHQPQKRYSGVYQQQGRMLTDADWNELVEILKERLNYALKDVVGNKAWSMGGTPRHRALKVIKASDSDPLTIQPGHVYVDGYQAEAKPDPLEYPTDTPPPETFDYDKQLDFPSPPALPRAPSLADNYIIYADVWERTVTHLMDERLGDKGLHGADTCTRKQMMAQVKWCPYDSVNPANNDPEQSARNPSKGDAELSLKLHQKTIEPDPCDPCAAQLDVGSKTGNYLFRVEVHDVKGDADAPTEITLKWSSENGAEQFEALPTKKEMPAGFISDKWVYDFFDMTSEKHLGVHFGESPWQPARGMLKEIKEPSSPYSVPTIPGSSGMQTFVRRWDGYCTLNLSSKTPLTGGMDRGIVLSTRKDSNALGYVKIDSSSLHINLSSINLDMVLDGKKFVAGDYWLADVREAEHDPLDPEKSKLIENELPHGIEHHYLTLGTVKGGVLQPNPEADRKYAFPPLTEMTRMFMAGGDGQEVVPGDPLKPLPQPLRVAVANGEWPVEGATVRFQIEDGGGSLSSPATGVKTNTDGIAECEWTPGNIAINPPAPWPKFEVKATLVDPDNPAQDLDHPPVFFYANLITADQVAYEPGCPVSGENAVHSHLATDLAVSLDLGTDGYYTVKEVLDALLCNLKAKHLPYDDPNCDSPSVTVKSLLSELGLDFDNDGHITVSDVLDTLLCKLRAKHIPYDPTLTAKRWEDINETSANLPDNVQNAIDQLVNNLEASDIRYELPLCETTDYDVPTFKKLIEENIVIEAGETNPKIKAVWDAVLCLLDAKHTPYDYKKEADRWGEVIDERSWNDITEGYSIKADWVKNFGGGNADYIRGVAVDSDGNVVLTGTFSGTINFGGSDLTSESDSAIFLVKLKPTGEHIWSTKFEISNTQFSGQSVIVDSSQNIILVGVLTYLEQAKHYGNGIFLAKFSVEGGILWESGFRGQETSFGYTAAIDSDDNVIVSGFFQGTMTYGKEEPVLHSVGKADIFLAKLGRDDGQVEWANNYGGEEYDVGHNVGVDSDNNIVLTGFFQGTIDFGGDAGELNSQGKSDIFVAKFGSDGSCLWAQRYGGTRSDYGRGLVLDEEKNIYLTGYFQKEITFGDVNDVLTSKDGYDVYIAKLSGNGEHIWSRSFPGTKSDFGHAVAITTDGTVALVGYFAGQVNFGGRDLVSQGETDAFLALFNPEGEHLFSESIGGTGADMSTRLAAGPNNSLIIAGIHRGNINIAGVEINSAGQSDVFVARFFPPYNGPTTVQSAIDLLLTEFDNSDIAYQLPSCSNVIYSIRKRLFPVDGSSTVRDVLNALLCMLDATTIPYDRNTNAGSLKDGFVDKSGDTMTGQLNIDDGSSDNIHNLLYVKGIANIKGSIVIGENNHRDGKIRLWQESNNDDDSVSHAIGTEVFHNTYGAGSKYPNSIGHRFYRGGGELIAQIGFGGGGKPENRLDSFFQGRIGIGTTNKLSMLTVKGIGGVWKTGRVSVEEGSSIVQGVGTRFLSEFGTGDLICIEVSQGRGRLIVWPSIVDTVTNDTLLHTTRVSPNTLTGARYYSYSSLFRADERNGEPSFIISHEGHVGIGTNDPGTDFLDVRGRCYSEGGWHVPEADYAEYFESVSASSVSSGTSVTLAKNGNIRPSKKGEIPIGIVTSSSAIVGNSYKEWPKKYLRDEFGKLIMEKHQEEIMAPKLEKMKKERQKIEKKTIEEEVTQTEVVFEKKKYRQKKSTETVTREIEEPVFEEVDLYDAEGKNVIGRHRIPVMETYEEEIEVLDEDGQPVLVGTRELVTEQRPKLNPDYDESREYVSREKRPEWNCVGLLGQLHLRKGQPVAPTWIKIKDISDEVELWLVK